VNGDSDFVNKGGARERTTGQREGDKAEDSKDELAVRKNEEEEEAVVEGVREAGPFSASRTLVSHSVVARFRSSILRRRCP